MNPNDTLLKWLAIVLRIYADILILVGYVAILVGMCWITAEYKFNDGILFIGILFHSLLAIAFVGVIRIRPSDLQPEELEKIKYED